MRVYLRTMFFCFVFLILTFSIPYYDYEIPKFKQEPKKNLAPRPYQLIIPSKCYKEEHRLIDYKIYGEKYLGCELG